MTILDTQLNQRTTSRAAEDRDLIAVGDCRLGSWRIRIDREALTTPQIRRTYQRIAHRWAQTVRRLRVARAYARIFAATPGLGTAAAVGDSLTVLDCGVGAGDFAAALMAAVDRPVALTGIDLSREMLRQAEAALDGLGAVTLREADIRALPFADAQFDVVMAAHVLEHLPDPETGLREMVRVLRPGGRLVLCVTARSLFGLYVHLNWRTQLRAISWWRETITGAGDLAVDLVVDDLGGAVANMSVAVAGVKAAPGAGSSLSELEFTKS